jgi:hypothetical protein
MYMTMATNDPHSTEIVVDVRIVSVDENYSRIQEFEEIWAESEGFSGGSIKIDPNGYNFIAIRTKYKFDKLSTYF